MEENNGEKKNVMEKNVKKVATNIGGSLSPDGNQLQCCH